MEIHIVKEKERGRKKRSPVTRRAWSTARSPLCAVSLSYVVLFSFLYKTKKFGRKIQVYHSEAEAAIGVTIVDGKCKNEQLLELLRVASWKGFARYRFGTLVAGGTNERETKQAANAATHAHQERPGEEEDLCCF